MLQLNAMCLTLGACREERRFTSVVIPTIMLSGAAAKTYVVLRDELDELRGGIGNYTVCIFAGLHVDPVRA